MQPTSKFKNPVGLIKEAAYYLGIKNPETLENPFKLYKEIDLILFEYEGILKGKSRYRLFDIENDGDKIKLLPQGTVFYSKGLSKHLKACNKVFVLYATLGFDADKEINRLQMTDIKKAVLLDACASLMLEKYLDGVMTQLKSDISSEAKLTDRFSPGFSDLPLESNKTVLTILDAFKRAGIVQNEGGLMSPSKTVTAFAGVING